MPMAFLLPANYPRTLIQRIILHMAKANGLITILLSFDEGSVPSTLGVSKDEASFGPCNVE